jgi:hypothetical protein
MNPRVFLTTALLTMGWAPAAPVAAQAVFPGQNISPARLLPMRAESPYFTQLKMGRPYEYRPDSVARRLLAQYRVRTILKVRLDQEGRAQEIISHQRLDRAGNLLPDLPAAEPAASPAAVAAPGPALPAVRTRESGMPLRSGAGRPGPVTRQRAERSQFSPHPDTVVTLVRSYSPQGQPELHSATYRLFAAGRITDMGQLDIKRLLKAQRKAAPEQQAAAGYAHIRRALATGRGRKSQHRWFYDAQHRLVREEVDQPVGPNAFGNVPQELNTVVRYTYNHQGQLIGRQESVSAITIPAQVTYTVFSYSPEGLVQGETCSTNATRPVFYRYQYEYYD